MPNAAAGFLSREILIYLRQSECPFNSFDFLKESTVKKASSIVAAACIEPLETRRMLSSGSVNVLGHYSGALTSSGKSYSIALDFTSESRRGVVTGTVAVRFSKHDTTTYSFTGRVVNSTVTASSTGHNSSFTGTVNTRRHTITGNVTATNASGTFSVKYISA